MWRCIEKAIEIGRVIEDPDIVRVGRLPLNDRQEFAGIAFKHHAIFVDSLKDGRGYRKVNSKRTVSTPCEHMMYEVTMGSPITVLERVNVDKAESKHRGGD